MIDQSVKIPDSSLTIPVGYREFIEEIKKKVREAQLRAGTSVNTELVKIYWTIGKSILESRKRKSGDQKSLNGYLRTYLQISPVYQVFQHAI
jgi:hypothetical protein